MLRVMQINAGSSYGGVSSMILNFYRHIDHQKIQFDFVNPYQTSFSMYSKEIEQSGGRIIELGITGKLFTYNYRLYKGIQELCKQNQYSIIHIHSGYSLFNFVTALGAKSAGVKRIIVHSHNAGNTNRRNQFYAKVLSKPLGKIANIRLACSKKAGEFMFSDDFTVINNGIELERYNYNEEIRNQIRAQYHLEGKYIIGHVGRFNNQKNHLFLLKVFQRVVEKNPDSILMLIGEGENDSLIHQEAIRLGIEKNIIYTGLISNVYDYYNAMDLFVLPSLFEGLPVVGIEAQANGLKCVFASTITKEVCLLDNAVMLDLNDSIDHWANELLKQEERIQGTNHILTGAGFDIQSSCDYLERLYLEDYDG